ncbi:hypothetical protein [Micromonospora sp. KC213]|uniref:DUF7426 family protein n=1 Tax=Micromonospora sp. KC213 TaxID=2530378 RepID=UPI0010457D30|nr:hypothetical protein [Micromonospora sp. KC213]TDC42125.1 hypothetical protein E1166_09040 [Micromonospora sp. KC213]
MMARLSGLDQYLDPGLTLALPGPDGAERDYVIPLPSAELGLWCRRIAESAGEVSAASTERELREATDRARARVEALPKLPGDLSFEERLLGDAHPRMLADRVPDPYVQFAAQTVYVWIIGGEEAAERWWTSGGRPPAPGPVPNRADRRAARGGTSTAAADATREPASTSGTTSRRRSGRRRQGGKSPGQRS